MKFLYEYQDKANKRHTGCLTAPTRAAAYAALKTQGIKPIRCDEAPGLVNLIFGKGKRWIAIVILAAIASVSTYLAFTSVRGDAPARPAVGVLDSSTRRQVIGDAAIIEKGIRTGWSDVFSHEGDRFLASFAVPGYSPAVRSTTEEKVREALSSDSSKRSSPENVQPSLESRQILAIVAGMKDELRRFLAAGGTIVEYGQRLVARQEEEIKYYKIAQRDIEIAMDAGKDEETVVKLWEKHNAALRKMGVRTIPYPSERENAAEFENEKK